MSASFLLLRVTVHFAPLGCIPTLLVSEPALGATRTLICSYSCVFLPPMSLAIRTSAFSFVGALNVFYIFQRHGVCLVDHVDLICSLYSWWQLQTTSYPSMSPPFPQPPAPGNHHPTLYFRVQLIQIPHLSESIQYFCLFLSVISFSIMPIRASFLLPMAGFSSFYG